VKVHLNNTFEPKGVLEFTSERYPSRKGTSQHKMKCPTLPKTETKLV